MKINKIAERALWVIEGIALYMIIAIYYKVVILGM